MTVACPDCRSVFRIDPAKVPASGVRARCSVCGGVIAIAGGTLSAMSTPSVPNVAHGAPAAGSALGAPSPRATTGSHAAASASRTEPDLAAARSTTGAHATTAPSIGSAPATPVAPPRAEPPRPQSATPLAPTASTPPAAPAAGAAAGELAPRRPINPFLQADPGQRARRLARALVSDLVAYNPQKRDEGLKQGTLRQLFREEIKKSYEEYVEQVGRDLAESTPHFQEALNDILGAGRKLF